ncbi:MAG: hypothetical protein CME70_04360 [Halobacteriovorax sp.]|nr:hypothetical protein [Halobacteriovorax sp.]|tara:strand:+ start:40271 stop:40858 length:588 start_codon:yes stop_codon:yes gene_type:complete
MFDLEKERILSDYLFGDISEDQKRLLKLRIEQDLELRTELEKFHITMEDVSSSFIEVTKKASNPSSVFDAIAAKTFEQKEKTTLAILYKRLMERNPYFFEFIFLITVVCISIIELEEITSASVLSQSFTNTSYLINTLIAFYTFTIIRRIHKESEMANSLGDLNGAVVPAVKISSSLKIFKLLMLVVLIILAIQL